MELPFTKKYTLASKLSQQELLSRLNDVIEIPEEKKVKINVNIMGFTNKHGTKPYRGAVKGAEFVAVREIMFANSFMPVIKGQVQQQGPSGKVVMKMGFERNTFLFLAVFNLSLLVLLVMGILGKLDKGNEEAVIAIPIVLTVLNAGIFGFYYFEIRKARKFFALLLAAEIS